MAPAILPPVSFEFPASAKANQQFLRCDDSVRGELHLGRCFNWVDRATGMKHNNRNNPRGGVCTALAAVAPLLCLRQMTGRTSQILELGSPGIFTDVLNAAYGDTSTSYGSVNVSSTHFDLTAPYPLETNSFDVVVSMEVVEHLKDLHVGGDITQADGRVDPAKLLAMSTRTFSGVKHSLRESWRVLRPGGTLFLTTPNAQSWDVLRRAIGGNWCARPPPLAHSVTPRVFGCSSAPVGTGTRAAARPSSRRRTWRSSRPRSCARSWRAPASASPRSRRPAVGSGTRRAPAAASRAAKRHKWVVT
jgi:SAM-dependent methyltransferase